MAAKRKALELAFIALIIATVAFIFIQSALPPKISAKESEAVKDVLEEIIPPDTEVGETVHKNVRKIAHFVEFALFGAELALYIYLLRRKTAFIVLSYPAALILALFDESIQMFSGRGPSVFDVWIDFSGFVFAASLVYISAFSFQLLKRKLALKGKWSKNGKDN